MRTSWADPELVLDLETYSSADLGRGGVKRYTEAPDFEILLLSYAFGDEPVQVWDWTAEGPPMWLRDALLDPELTKVAWNYSFERTCLNAALGVYTPPEQWRDAMTLAAMHGLPMSLESAGAAMQLEEQKLDTGKALIRYFCKPCAPTITNKGRTRNRPEHAPDKWEAFKTYCGRDTEAERTIYKRLKAFPVPDWERELEAVDARINEHGVLADIELAKSAVVVDEEMRKRHTEELRRLTGLENPNSVSQLKAWLETAGVGCESLNKATVADLIQKVPDSTTRRVLELRQLLGKTSTKKYEAILDAACADDRVRGLLQYYGAGRTGRWAGRRVQLQNLAQNHLDRIGMVRELVRERDLETLECLYDSIPDVLSQLIRTALIARPGYTFLVADYSAIEARVIAYLAGEDWVIDAFAAGEDIYCKTASQMFGVPVEKHGVNAHLRQKGKIATLACGYGGGVAALQAFGADKMGLSTEEMQSIVDKWRKASPRITRLWREVEKHARMALENPGRKYSVPQKRHDALRAGRNEMATGGEGYSTFFNTGLTVCEYRRTADALRCKLPSGRILNYWGAELKDSGGDLSYMAQNQTTRQWERTGTWGGKLVENIVQAFARDCLATAILRLHRAGYKICFHVHDEIIVEAPEGSRWEEIAEIMGEPIPWAPGLLLRADGYETKFYQKD